MTNPVPGFAPPTGSFVAGRKGTEFGHLTPEVNSGYALFRQIVDFVNNLKSGFVNKSGLEQKEVSAVKSALFHLFNKVGQHQGLAGQVIYRLGRFAHGSGGF